jgi:hypothetical protein
MLARAYAELSSCKPIGLGARGPIPWTAMIEWCHFHGLEHHVAIHAINVLRHVDNFYIERAAAKAEHPKTPSRRRR